MNFFENIAKQKIVWRPFMKMVYTGYLGRVTKTKKTSPKANYAARGFPLTNKKFSKIFKAADSSKYIRKNSTSTPATNKKSSRKSQSTHPPPPLCGVQARKKKRKKEKKNANLMVLASWRNGVNFRKSGKSLMIIPVT